MSIESEVVGSESETFWADRREARSLDCRGVLRLRAGITWLYAQEHPYGRGVEKLWNVFAGI